MCKLNWNAKCMRIISPYVDVFNLRGTEPKIDFDFTMPYLDSNPFSFHRSAIKSVVGVFRLPRPTETSLVDRAPRGARKATKRPTS